MSIPIAAEPPICSEIPPGPGPSAAQLESERVPRSLDGMLPPQCTTRRASRQSATSEGSRSSGRRYSGASIASSAGALQRSSQNTSGRRMSVVERREARKQRQASLSISRSQSNSAESTIDPMLQDLQALEDLQDLQKQLDGATAPDLPPTHEGEASSGTASARRSSLDSVTVMRDAVDDAFGCGDRRQVEAVLERADAFTSRTGRKLGFEGPLSVLDQYMSTLPEKTVKSKRSKASKKSKTQVVNLPAPALAPALAPVVDAGGLGPRVGAGADADDVSSDAGSDRRSSLDSVGAVRDAIDDAFGCGDRRQAEAVLERADAFSSRTGRKLGYEGPLSALEQYMSILPEKAVKKTKKSKKSKKSKESKDKKQLAVDQPAPSAAVDVGADGEAPRSVGQPNWGSADVSPDVDGQTGRQPPHVQDENAAAKAEQQAELPPHAPLQPTVPASPLVGMDADGFVKSALAEVQQVLAGRRLAVETTEQQQRQQRQRQQPPPPPAPPPPLPPPSQQQQPQPLQPPPQPPPQQQQLQVAWEPSPAAAEMDRRGGCQIDAAARADASSAGQQQHDVPVAGVGPRSQPRAPPRADAGPATAEPAGPKPHDLTRLAPYGLAGSRRAGDWPAASATSAMTRPAKYWIPRSPSPTAPGQRHRAVRVPLAQKVPPSRNVPPDSRYGAVLHSNAQVECPTTRPRAHSRLPSTLAFHLKLSCTAIDADRSPLTAPSACRPASRCSGLLMTSRAGRHHLARRPRRPRGPPPAARPRCLLVRRPPPRRSQQSRRSATLRTWCNRESGGP